MRWPKGHRALICHLHHIALNYIKSNYQHVSWSILNNQCNSEIVISWIQQFLSKPENISATNLDPSEVDKIKEVPIVQRQSAPSLLNHNMTQ